MVLDRLEMQKIVNRIMSILGKNINIMDSKGIIVASGDKSRLDTFHEGALIAAREKQEVIVTDENLNQFKGCKKGVNIPIYFNNEVQGVIGITGDPAEIKGYGLIVKELVELMIHENERRRVEFFHNRAIKNFAKEIIKDSEYGESNTLKSRAELIEFNLNIKRVVIVADICNFAAVVERYSEDSEIMVQKVKQDIVDLIGSIEGNRHDIVFNLSEDRFVILKSVNADIKQYCENIEEVLDKHLNLKMYLGIGSECSDVTHYHKSYILAHKVVNLGRRLDSDKLIYFSEDYRMQLLLDSTSEENKEEFFKSVFNISLEEVDEDLKDTLRTIKVYFEKGMSVKDTAQAMFLHRNTVLYRINKFREKYSIDVTIPYNCMLVYMANNIYNSVH